MAVLAGCGSQGAARGLHGDEQLETTTLRLGYSPAICFAAMYVAEDLLRSEGFSDLQYVKRPTAQEAIIAGEADLATTDVWSILSAIDQSHPLTVLRGLPARPYR